MFIVNLVVIVIIDGFFMATFLYSMAVEFHHHNYFTGQYPCRLIRLLLDLDQNVTVRIGLGSSGAKTLRVELEYGTHRRAHS